MARMLLQHRAPGSRRPICPASGSGCAAYSQTTAAWMRGILQNDYGVDIEPGALGHVRGRPCGRIPRPARASNGRRRQEHPATCCARASSMPRSTAPTCPMTRLQSVIPDPEGRGGSNGTRKHKAVPHQPHGGGDRKTREIESGRGARGLPVCSRPASRRPDCQRPGIAIDLLPYGFEACRPSLETMIRYQEQQKLLPRPLTSTNCSTPTRAHSS